MIIGTYNDKSHSREGRDRQIGVSMRAQRYGLPAYLASVISLLFVKVDRISTIKTAYEN